MTARRAIFALAAGAVGVLLTEDVHAAAYQIEARTEAQAYQIRTVRGDPTNPVLLPRRRLAQYLGLNVFELLTGQDLGFESNLRIFADLGMPRGEASKLDGVRSEDADLLYANVSYRGAGFEGRLGRQLYADVMDVLAFDGLQARYMTRFGIGAEAYAGLWVKGTSFFGSPVYQPDGTRETDARRIAINAPATEPDPVLDDPEPIFGAKLLAQDFWGFSGALGYRKALVAGHTDLERAAAELRYGRGFGLNAFAGVDLDLLQLQVAQARGELRYDHAYFSARAEALRLSPVLSTDSIWYYFATAPRDEANVRVEVFPSGPLRFHLQGSFTHYNQSIRTDSQLWVLLRTLPSGDTLGGSAGAAGRWGRWRSALDVTARAGALSSQVWTDLTGGYVADEGRYTLDGRISLANLSDRSSSALRGVFFGAQAWGSYVLSRSARLSLVIEQNVNPYTRYEAKAFLLFDLKANL